MPTPSTAYLVIRREDGFGEVFALEPGMRVTLGRAASNHIVLRDDMCSREHAEVYTNANRWYFRDSGSLNGSRINGKVVKTDQPLSPRDEILLGRTVLVFVEDLSQLPDLPVTPARSTPNPDDQLMIRKRLGQTRYLEGAKPEPPTATHAVLPHSSQPSPHVGQPSPGAANVPPPGHATVASATVASTTVLVPTVSASPPIDRRPETRVVHEQDVARLYRLALQMGGAKSLDELVAVVLDGLLEATTADVGAVLSVKAGRDMELLAYRQRHAQAQTYHKVSQYVSNEVLTTREAILAENVAGHESLKNRDSITDLQVTSLICAPITYENQIIGLIHLYCTTLSQTLNIDDLEFALAVARQCGVAMMQLERQASLTAQNQTLRAQLRLDSELVGTSSALKAIESQIARVAGTNATVLIRGESGVGKELVARAIHASSARRDGPFVCINCAALTETLLESELFGHEKGAFTGATERLIGKFESAHRGTIFLDEIGEMALGTQAKFLRVLEGQAFERVGGSTPIRVDVRVVAATNKPLEEAIRQGTFRRDLFYRLQVVEIRVPPLREHKSDIPALAEHFLHRFVRETGRKIRGFTPAALRKLQDYHWPGNVRELRNAIERAVALGYGPEIDAGDIWLSALDLHQNGPATVAENTYEAISIDELERRHILATLQHTGGNKSQAAHILGIERSTLDRKLKLYERQAGGAVK
jgi:transcriptional regulator with GAF, ATPase, and Fis domain